MTCSSQLQWSPHLLVVTILEILVTQLQMQIVGDLHIHFRCLITNCKFLFYLFLTIYNYSIYELLNLSNQSNLHISLSHTTYLQWSFQNIKASIEFTTYY